MTGESWEDGSASLPPDGAFTLLGNETRIGILEVLWAAYDPYAGTNALPFSELFDRTGADDTGNFNYHLGKLTGHFVRQTDDGYELAAPGFRIVRAVVADGVTGDPLVGPTPVDANCPRCRGSLAVSYEGGTTWVRCSECEGYWPRRGGEIFGFGLPPAGLRDRDVDGILEATIVYSIHRFATMMDAVCPECGSAVETSLSVCRDHDPGEGVCEECESHFVGVITAVCTSCKFPWRSPSYAPVSHHPALIAFYYDHGIEHDPGTWAAIRRGLDWDETLLSTDPASLRISVSCAGDRRHFRLDATGAVVDVEG
jgi:hypothetical protein